jgi:ankyrin repeat protein
MASIFDFDGGFNRSSPQSTPPVPLERTVFNAACRRDLRAVEKILRESATKLNLHMSVNGFNCAHISARKGCTEILAAFLNYDETLIASTTEDNNRTLHMLAAFDDQIDTLKYLCNFSISRTQNDPKGNGSFKNIHEQLDAIGNSLLHYSVWGGSLRCTTYLIESCGFNCNCLNHDKLTPLQMASAGNYHEIVSYLLPRSTNTAAHGDMDSVATLTANVEEEEVSIGGLNSLHRAAIYGSLDVIKLLISSSSSSNPSMLHFNVDAPTLNGTTALHLAAKHGHWDTAAYLVDHGHAAVDQSNHFGLTALHFACIG